MTFFTFPTHGKLVNKALLQLYLPALPKEFPSIVHSAFSLLFPNICISFDEIDNQSKVLVNTLNCPRPEWPKDFISQWSQWADEHPCVAYRRRGGTQTILQISDFFTKREFSKTAFYQNFWKELGVSHQLSAVVPVSDRIIAVSVNRDLAFTHQEVQLMRSLQPHLVQAYWISKVHGLAQHTSTWADPHNSEEKGNIEVLDGTWRGNVISGKIWKKTSSPNNQ
ncbi:MAG: hypothetical protein ACFUZC_22180 [Chthoniobacteraceae bacterium]